MNPYATECIASLALMSQPTRLVIIMTCYPYVGPFRLNIKSARGLVCCERKVAVVRPDLGLVGVINEEKWKRRRSSLEQFKIGCLTP